MKISFLGSAKTVTGSCHLIETDKTKILIDCGMFQGNSKADILNYQPFGFLPSELDFVLLTHAHIDHSGRIPKLFKEGYTGRVISTKATVELCGILLPDSGHIQEFEAEWRNRKRKRAGKRKQDPIYTQLEAEQCLKYFDAVQYNNKIQLTDDIEVRFVDAGHMLGSSIIEIWITENNESTKVVFTGDLGNRNIPILREPSILESADYLVMESTYGDRIHIDSHNKAERFLNIVYDTIRQGGNVVIPSFAVGRTQEIIYELNKIIDGNDKRMNLLKSTPVYLDSPMAISATEIYRKNPECYDSEAKKYIELGEYPLDFPTLHFSRTADQSRALNEIKGGAIIISASGMCEAGRIKHHLKHNLWKENSTILFMGYQAEGTLGRRILEGEKKVRIFGEEISINAHIESIDGYSGHADQNGLMDWLDAIKKKPARVFLVHGEPKSMTSLSRRINDSFGIETFIPEQGQTVTLHGQTIKKTELDKHKVHSFKSLEVINMLEVLRDEMVDVEDIIKEDLSKAADEIKLRKLLNKLKSLEDSIINLIE